MSVANKCPKLSVVSESYWLMSDGSISGGDVPCPVPSHDIFTVIVLAPLAAVTALVDDVRAVAVFARTARVRHLA